MATVIDSYPLSPLQEGMLFNTLYAPHSGVDITQIICRMHHPLDQARFEEAWRAVVARHAILRTAFRWEDLDTPIQDVHGDATLEYAVEDLRGLDAAEQEARIEEYLAADRRRGFDIATPPLVRIALFVLGEHEHVLVWPYHHLTLDSTSFTIILEEVFAIYEAALSGNGISLDEPAPFRRYIDWLQNQDVAASESFWRELLAGYTTPVSLSVAHDPASLRPGGGYGRGEIALDPAIRPVLEEWAKENGFTLYNCFQAAWAIILSRYSGQKDVVFAAVRGCRGVPIEDADRIVGMFINTLPVRARIYDRMPLIDFLKELRGQHVAIREHAHSALAQIQRWSDIPPNMPLFESLINYAGTPWDAYLTAKGGMHGQREWDIRNQTNIPLSFDISEAPEPRIVVDYDRGRFDAAAIDAMLGHFKTIVEAMAENHDRAVGDLPMLTGAERRTILVDWNDRAADFPRNETIHGLFERRAAETPDAPAVVLGDRALSYGELNGRANRLAHRLLALGVAPETPIAVCMDRTPELVVALLGVLKAGGAYVPIDPAYPAERIAFMLEDTGSPVVLTEEKVAGALPPNDAHEIRVDTGRDEMADELDANPGPFGGPDALAYIIYTSGSTGTPKGVCCRHESVLNLFADFDRRRPIEPGDRCALWTSVSFDVSVYEIFTALLAGGALHIASDAIRFDAGVFIPWLAEREIASAYVPPLMLADLREWVEANPGKSALRRLLVGVEPIPEPLLSAIAAAVPGLSIINGYGPTETTVCATLYDVTPGEAPDRITPIGRPVQNSAVYLLDGDGRPVPVGVPGEIHIGGAGMARGYHERPDLTAERFVPDPISGVEGARLYRTGDNAFFHGDGNIEFVGRVDYQLKVRGFRVEPGEIEFVLRQHPAVREALVAGSKDRTGTMRLVAYLVPEKTAPATSDLRDFLGERLPDYMVPTSWVTLDAFPLTPNGKLDRDALPEPEVTRADLSSEYLAPRNETEMQLARIWEKVMGIEQIGVRDNFFDLGGHSLLAVRLFTEITRTFGDRISLADIFQSPTIERIAAMLSGGGTEHAGRSIVPIREGGSKPPVFFVHAYGGGVFFYRELADHLDADRPFYGVQAVGLDGKRPPLETVEEMAALYIDEIKSVQPAGPYVIGGRCLGAYVALEMAHQLRLRGEEIGLLAILDSYWMPRKASTGNKRAVGHLNKLAAMSLPEQIEYLRKYSGNRLRKIRLGLARLFSRCCFRLGRPIPAFLMDYYINTCIPHLNLHAEMRYTPPVYGGPITFYQATAEVDRDPRSFWGKLTSEGIDVIMVPASHKDILVEPNVQVLAEKLRRSLAALDGAE